MSQSPLFAPAAHHAAKALDLSVEHDTLSTPDEGEASFIDVALLDDDFRVRVANSSWHTVEVVDNDGKRVGIGITVTAPDTEYYWPGRESEEATVNWNAIGSTDPRVARASAVALLFAAHMAEWLTRELAPAVAEARARYEEERREASARAVVQREQRGATSEALSVRLTGKVARLTCAPRGNAKTRFTGTVTVVSDTEVVLVDSKGREHRLSLNRLVTAEIKVGARFLVADPGQREIDALRALNAPVAS